MKVAILGAGAYGLAISQVLVDNGCEVSIWTKVIDEYEMLINKKIKNDSLSSFKFDNNIKITMDIKEAINDTNAIFIATSIKFVKTTLEEMKKYYKKEQHICVASKGIDQDNLCFALELVKKILCTKKVAVISGPTFAKDILNKQPSALTLATNYKSSAILLKKYLNNDYLKINISNDVFGVEMWGAVKNIIAIACGIIDGMECSTSTKSMFMTKVINDFIKMIAYFGGKKETFLSYAGIGDLWLTCNSFDSRNYTFGKLIGNNKNKEEINRYKDSTTIEGLYTLKSLYLLLNKYKYEMSFINIMYEIIYLNHDNKSILVYLDK